MKKGIMLVILALISMPLYADTIEFSFSIDDVNTWASSQPRDFDWDMKVRSERRPSTWHDGDSTWNLVRTFSVTWAPSMISLQISRRDAAGNVTMIRSGGFQVRADTVAAISGLQSDLNGLYVDLAEKQAEIVATLSQVGGYLYAPDNDKPHPGYMDTLLTKERERIAIESEIAQKTEAIRTEEGSGLPGWDGDVTVTEAWYEN